jgi:site-specific recombinase XerD
MADSRPAEIVISQPALPPRRAQRPIEDPLLAYLGSLSPRSRLTVQERLRAVARLMQAPYEQVEWESLRAHHVEWIRQALTERGVAPSTVNVTLSALKGIARRARNLNLMTSEEYDRIRDVRGAKGVREPVGRSATAGELEALVRACLRDRSPAGVRDVALLGVLYIGGIRRAELVGLGLGDYTPDPPTLRVRGKGDKHRSVPLTAAAAAALDDWLRIRGDSEGSLFVPLTQRGEVAGTSMTGRAISKVLAKRVGQAGVERLSPHDMRRTFIGDLLERGIDISRVREMAGHASVDTTARYDRRPEAERRKAVEVLHYPYTKRVRKGR